jgi:hypothetical protein
MPDELDAQLLRRFADSHQPLVDAQFVAQVLARMPPASGVRLHPAALRSVPGTIVGALLTGIAAPLRLRHAGLMALAAAAVTVWATFA